MPTITFFAQAILRKILCKQTNNKLRPLVIALQAALATGIALPAAPILAGETTLVSVNSVGVQANGGSDYSAISADGRYVAFSSHADNLVAGGAVASDIYVRDRLTNKTTRVSLSNTGKPGNDNSYRPAISADGRFVAFQSAARNLVTGDTNQATDIFVRDRLTNQTTRVSVTNTGAQGKGYSYSPAISADGRFVAFESTASNLVVGDTNGARDIFVRDRTTNQTTRVSVASTGIQGDSISNRPVISADGRFVAFDSYADNLVTDDTNSGGGPCGTDVFVHDRRTSQTTRVSVNNAGVEGNCDSDYPAISADGRVVAFRAGSSNLVAGDTNGRDDIFVRDRTTNKTTRVSATNTAAQSNGHSLYPAISADGRFVAFKSKASNLVTGDTKGLEDVFVRDRATNQTTRVSVSSTGGQGNYDVGRVPPAISADGRIVTFMSGATTLVVGDANAANDIFLHDRLLNPAATANITLTQTVSANPVTVGASFSYTATVINQGPNNATNVVLSDYAPINGTVGLPALVSSQGKCTQGQISICRLGTISAGQQATVQMTYSAIKKGVVNNRVTVSASPKDPTPFNSVTTKTIINP